MLPKNQGGLGVRNLNDINKACLMKLAWNLKLEENKLCSHVLIGKFGRGTWASGEFQCKTADSYIWKSVADCCEIIKGEEAWSLGDGNTVNFWLDKWFDNRNPLHDIVHNIPPDVMNMKVVDYVDENKRWKLDSLIPLLPGELLNKLLAFPEPDPCMGPDVKYWPGEKSGSFTVSSAYHHLRNVIAAPPVKPWKIIWQLDVPERIRSFVWKITHGKLPTKLYCSSWSGSNSDCRHYLGVSESIQHALRDCPRATAVWKQLVPMRMRANFFGYSFEDWISYNLTITDEDRWTSIWAAACSFLWGWRNKEEHDSSFTRPYYSARMIQQYVHCYFASKEKFNPTMRKHSTVVNVCWKSAVSGYVTINTDGASKEGGSASGCGGVIHDTDGRWLGGFTRYLGETTSYIVELWGALEGLKLARSKGYHNIELQVDSQVVVDNLTGEATSTIEGRSLVFRIKNLLWLNWNVNIIHVYREANRVGGDLASMACVSKTGLCILDQPPANILHLLNDDCNGVFTHRLVTLV